MEVGQPIPDGIPVKIYQVDIRVQASKACRDNKSARMLRTRVRMTTQTDASMEGEAAVREGIPTGVQLSSAPAPTGGLPSPNVADPGTVQRWREPS